MMRLLVFTLLASCTQQPQQPQQPAFRPGDCIVSKYRADLSPEYQYQRVVLDIGEYLIVTRDSDGKVSEYFPGESENYVKVECSR